MPEAATPRFSEALDKSSTKLERRRPHAYKSHVLTFHLSIEESPDNKSTDLSARSCPPPPKPKPAIPTCQIAFILAGLTAGGGMTGYIRAGSIPSLVAGCSVGALYALGGYRIQNRQNYGIELALLASIVLAGSSIPRAIKSGKPLPAGLSALALFGLYSFGVAFVGK